MVSAFIPPARRDTSFIKQGPVFLLLTVWETEAVREVIPTNAALLPPPPSDS